MAFLNKTLGRLLTLGMSLAFFGLVGSVLLQVFSRWLLPKVPNWTEETSRMFLIWMVGFGGGLAFRERSYVNVDLLISLFPKWLTRVFARGTDLLIALFMLVFTREAWNQTVKMGMRQTSPALDIPMQYVFFALVVLGAGVVVFALAAFFLDGSSVKEGA